MRVFVTDTAGLIGDPLARPFLAADHPVTDPDGVSGDGGVARMRARRVGTSGPSDTVGTPAGRHRLVACAGSTPGGTPPGRSRAFAPLPREAADPRRRPLRGLNALTRPACVPPACVPPRVRSARRRDAATSHEPDDPQTPSAAAPPPLRSDPPPSGAPAMMALRSTALAAAGLLAFLLFWEAMPRLGLINPAFLPPPSTIPAAFLNEVRLGVWGEAVLSSLSHYVTGLCVGAGAGIALGLLSGMFRGFEAATAWIVRLLRPIPGLAWVPFAIIWFGVQPEAAVFIIAIGVFWIVFFATQGAVRGVDRDLIEVAQAFGFGSPWSRLTKILLPAATPGILVGLRTALGQAWMAVVAAEIFGVPGVGARMMQASSLLSTDIVVVYMLTMAALYGLFDTAFVALQGWLLRWRA